MFDIITILALIAISCLWDRNRRLNRIEMLSKEGRDLVQRHLGGKVFARDFFFSKEQQLSDKNFSSAIANTPGSIGKVEIGYLPYVPSFGLVIIDPDQPHGTCFVELYHHRSAEPNPAFELRASEDPFWYNFFVNQYKILWESCRIEELSKNGK